MTDYKLHAGTLVIAVAGKAVSLESRVVSALQTWWWRFVVLWALATVAGLLWTIVRGDLWDLAFATCIVVATYFLGRAMETTERHRTIDRR